MALSALQTPDNKWQGYNGAQMARINRSSWGPATPAQVAAGDQKQKDHCRLWCSHHRPGTSVLCPEMPAVTTSVALATHPSQSSRMMGGALALLSLKRSWRRRTLMREQVGPLTSARHDSSLLPLHSNIQAAAGLQQGAHALCHWCWAPIQEAGQPPKGQQGSAGVQLEMAALG